MNISNIGLICQKIQRSTQKGQFKVNRLLILNFAVLGATGAVTFTLCDVHSKYMTLTKNMMKHLNSLSYE